MSVRREAVDTVEAIAKQRGIGRVSGDRYAALISISKMIDGC
jgi:hypothetical protein